MQAAGAMTPRTKKEDQGWGVPLNTKKAHYFVNGRSLCSRWMFFGWLEDSHHDHPDNCKACMKARAKPAP
jgi:hypothetical protein